MRFADTGWAKEDHIHTALDEVEFVQAVDLFAPRRRLKREVEVGSCLTAGRRLERMAACRRRLLRS
jgi:hypothetical protein